MQHPVLTELSVAETLERWSRAVPVFLRQRMVWVGCVMAPFETLADVVTIRGLGLSRSGPVGAASRPACSALALFLYTSIQLETHMRRSDVDTKTVDVREVPPPQRHPMIFQTFDALQPGESFILLNDHDPKPLYYQFRFEREGQFTWEYLEQGPTLWQVRIGRSVS